MISLGLDWHPIAKGLMKSLPHPRIILIVFSALLLLSIGDYIYHYVLFTEQTWNLVFF